MKPRSLARNRLRRLGWLRFLLQLASVALVFVGVSVAVPFLFMAASGIEPGAYRPGNPDMLASAVLLSLIHI